MLASPAQIYHGVPGFNVGCHALTGPSGYCRASHTLPSGVTLSTCASTSTSATSTPNGGGSGSQQQLLGSSRPSLTSSHTGLGGASATNSLLNGSLQALGLASRTNITAISASTSVTPCGSNVGQATQAQQLAVHRSLGTLGSRSMLCTTNGNNGMKSSGNRLGVGSSHCGTVVGSGASSARSTSASISILVEEPLLDSVTPKESLGDSGTLGIAAISGNNGGHVLQQKTGSDKQSGSGFQPRVSTFGRNRIRNSNNSSPKALLITEEIEHTERDTDNERVDGRPSEKSRLVTASGMGAGGVPFEPLRDAVQHFSEKHLDKIRTFMAGVFARLPLPLKCTIEERHNGKKYAKLHFGCQGKCSLQILAHTHTFNELEFAPSFKFQTQTRLQIFIRRKYVTLSILYVYTTLNELLRELITEFADCIHSSVY